MPQRSASFCCPGSPQGGGVWGGPVVGGAQAAYPPKSHWLPSFPHLLPSPQLLQPCPQGHLSTQSLQVLPMAVGVAGLPRGSRPRSAHPAWESSSSTSLAAATLPWAPLRRSVPSGCLPRSVLIPNTSDHECVGGGLPAPAAWPTVTSVLTLPARLKIVSDPLE